MGPIDQAEQDLHDAWAASGYVAGQGAPGSPAPSLDTTSQDDASMLGMGALILLGMMWVGTGSLDKALRRAGA